MKDGPLTYAAAGVDYDPIDRFKRLAQKAASGIRCLNFGGFPPLYEFQEKSRGESAAVISARVGFNLGLVDEGLGTKNLVADACANQLGVQTSYYDCIARDTVAMTVNDLITVGALPIGLTMHLQVGDSGWFANRERAEELVEGWATACQLSGAAWVGGETPVLSGIILPDAASLSCSAVGSFGGHRQFSGVNIRAGDRIVLLGSSGIHANGLTLARRIAAKLPDGYKTVMSPPFSGDMVPKPVTYGEGLLLPTIIYVPLIRACHLAFLNGEVRYGINITGHGLRKLMRATEPFEYIVTQLPKPQPVFAFIQQHAGLDDRQMYETFNMGAGFALIVDPKVVHSVIDLAYQCGFDVALNAGEVRASSDGRRRVVLESIGVTYEEDTLQVR